MRLGARGLACADAGMVVVWGAATGESLMDAQGETPMEDENASVVDVEEEGGGGERGEG